MSHRNKAITLRVPPAMNASLNDLQSAMPSLPRGTLLRLLLEVALEGSTEEQAARITRKLLKQDAFERSAVPHNRLNAKHQR